VTVGPPIDLLIYAPGELRITHHRRFDENDPHLMQTRRQWEQVLRRAVHELPPITFGESRAAS
jgi:putative proteasome-type protease